MSNNNNNNNQFKTLDLVKIIKKLRVCRIKNFWRYSVESEKEFEDNLNALRKLYAEREKSLEQKEEKERFNAKLAKTAENRGINGDSLKIYLKMLEQHMPIKQLMEADLEMEKAEIARKIKYNMYTFNKEIIGKRIGGKATIPERLDIYKSAMGLDCNSKIFEIFNINIEKDNNKDTLYINYIEVLKNLNIFLGFPPESNIDDEFFIQLKERTKEKQRSYEEKLKFKEDRICTKLIKTMVTTRVKMARGILELDVNENYDAIIMQGFKSIKKYCKYLGKNLLEQNRKGEEIDSLKCKAKEIGLSDELVTEYLRYTKYFFSPKDNKTEKEKLEDISRWELLKMKKVYEAFEKFDLDEFCNGLCISKKMLLDERGNIYRYQNISDKIKNMFNIGPNKDELINIEDYEVGESKINEIDTVITQQGHSGKSDLCGQQNKKDEIKSDKATGKLTADDIRILNELISSMGWEPLENDCIQIS